MTTKKPNDIDLDFDAARSNYHELISSLKGQIDMFKDIAEESGHPRAYEVLANMYKICGDMNDKLMEHVRRKQIIDEDRRRNNLIESDRKKHAYIGKSSELQRLLKEKKKEDVRDAEIVEEDNGTESAKS